MVASCRILSLAQHNLPGSGFQLVAFIVLVETLIKNEVKTTKSFLFAKVKEVLPNYCIPDHIEVLEKMPVNEHGKFPVIFVVTKMCNIFNRKFYMYLCNAFT